MERLMKRRHLAERQVRADIGGWVVADRRLLPIVFAADPRSPDLGPAEKETLVAGKPVEHRRRRGAERSVVRAIGDRQAREVTQTLAQQEIAVQVRAAAVRSDGAQLIRESPAARAIRGLVLGRPPGARRAARVEAPALFVESVSDLVADDGANR